MYMKQEVGPGWPGHDGAYWRIGMIYEWKGDPEKARQSFERAVRLNPGENRYRESLNALAKD